MSSQATKWKEEQILIICPGSRTTMAQLGCSELTPPAYRIPTRMFRDEETGEWRPYRTYRRKKQSATGDNANDATSNDQDAWEYVEDPDSDEGAVYPMQGGYIVNMEAFLAFLEHVHGLLTTTFHTTPIVLMTSSQWTRPDCEAIALYIFEKTRTPALSMINSALATQYGLKWPHMTVVDIGFEKVDVTCIYDSRIVNHTAVGFAGEPGNDDNNDRTISGGEVFTRRLQALLRDKGFTYEMAEQLKKSTICEVLPYVSENPRLMELPEDDASAPAAPAAAVATNSSAAVAAAGAAGTDEAQSRAIVDDDLLLDDGTVPAAEDGVLDVATIVTTGQTKEFLAKKEKERSERGRFGRRNKDKEAAEAAAAKPVRLPNSKRARVVFHYEEVVEEEEEEEEEEPQASNGFHKSDKSASTAAGTSDVADGSNAKSHDDDADGSDDGSEGEGSEMDEDEDEEGDGEDEDAGGEGSGEPNAAASDEKNTDKPKEESAASTEKPKVEDAAAPAPAETKAPEATPATAVETAEKPKEPEAAPAPPAAATSEEKPSTSEDATMEDAPASKEETTTDKTEAPAEPAEAPAEPGPATVAEETVSSAALVSTNPALAPAPVETAVVAPAAAEPQGRRYKRLRRDFEIGLERFTFADRYEIDRIVTAIYRTVQGIDEFYMRPACWDNLVFVGNGCRLRGLRDNILQTLNARHLISPSTATMFTSELPSNLGTPTGTGSQTPTGSFNTPPHQLPISSSSVNPLLQVATTNALGQSVVGGPGSVAGGEGANTHHFHAQTPTSIKLATLPTYLSEWTKNGFEEAMFLGAQVAARLAFCVHNLDAAGQEGQRQMSLSRVDYNELGPKGIRNHAMLG